jgi:hypothetical protein
MVIIRVRRRPVSPVIRALPAEPLITTDLAVVAVEVPAQP